MPSLSLDVDYLPTTRDNLQYLLWLDYDDGQGSAVETDSTHHKRVDEMFAMVHYRWRLIGAFQALVEDTQRERQESPVSQPCLEGQSELTRAAEFICNTSTKNQDPNARAVDPRQAGKRWLELVQLCRSDSILLLPGSCYEDLAAPESAEINQLNLCVVEGGSQQEYTRLKTRLNASGAALLPIFHELNGLATEIDRIVCSNPSPGMPLRLPLVWREPILLALNTHDC